MYTTGNRQDMVYEHRLSTAWDITTSTLNISKSVLSEENNINAVQWKPDGSKMYIVGSGNDKVHQYHISESFYVSGGADYSMSFQSTQRIYSQEYYCTIPHNEYNFPSNPSILSNDSYVTSSQPGGNFHDNNPPEVEIGHWNANNDGWRPIWTKPEIINFKGTDGGKTPDIRPEFRTLDFKPYITKIGLYNNRDELLMIATLPTPIQKPSDQDLTIKVQMDY